MNAVKIRYRSGYKYVLDEDFAVGVEITDSCLHPFFMIKDGTLLIRKGYAWDGPSGPACDTKTFMRASLIHDCLYQAMREGLLEESWKPYADRFMRRVCLLDGMWRARAWWCWRAVVRMGAGALRKKKVYTAP